MKKLALILPGLLWVLTGCSTSDDVKREPLAPPVSDKFNLEGHLKPEDDLNKTVAKPAAIPELVTDDPINLDPREQKTIKRYSVSAINVPVSDLLFNLAKNADKQLDLSSAVQGRVTINAINQPLDRILQRVTAQIDALYELQGDTIVISPDKPFWKSYEVDYVNVAKNINDTTVMKMSVGNVAQGVSLNNGNQSSRFKLDTKAENNFWKTLEENVSAIAMLEVKPVKTVSHKRTYDGDRQSDRQNMGDEYWEGTYLQGSSTQALETVTSTTSEKVQNVAVNKEAGLLTVFTSGRQHKEIEAYLENTLHRTNKQVLIEATVVEVELNDQYQAGVDWSAVTSNSSGSSAITQSMLGSNLSSDPNFSINLTSLGTWDFSLGIKLLQKFGDTKVLSSPKIMAMNNQAALLKVVKNEVYFTVDVNRESATSVSAGVTTYETMVHSVPVGFMMHVTPFITDSGEVSLNIRPTLSRIVSYVDDPNPELAKEDIVSRVPVIQEREMDSVLRLRDKQTAIIGGLIQDTHSNQREGVPGLVDIPWVGDLFSYRDDTVQKSELIIFIRPIIINNPDIEHGDLKAMKPLLQTTSN
ncbi:type II and III secretion system protein [Thiomicrospira sp. XS5]|uniref:pilus (MSHA type) biogenesis protein MshL n=1 Tax=Thiomicrospira sp. XS5 TaxID=1775636 RepID=UPI000749B467|nr:pilus (MSHA type) biogenesis protein MshL [Thiomicrospira sp. XS5]KUJ74789.1 type II and III secretion system protein [Thiomicrospira sp. XS5]